MLALKRYLPRRVRCRSWSLMRSIPVSEEQWQLPWVPVENSVPTIS